MAYNTKQKDLILDTIKSYKKEFTIKDIYSKLEKEVGLTTIYRLIDKLVLENRIAKNINKDNITYYTYLEECNHNNHFYLRCSKCGNTTHIDCDCITDLANHISKEHSFNLENNICINGICKKCRGV